MFLLVYVALLTPVLAVTTNPYWETTPHIQTFSVLLISSGPTANSGLITTANYFPTLNRTYTATPNIVLSCTELQTSSLTSYYLHYLSASGSTTALTLTLNVTWWIYSFTSTVMLYTSELSSSIQHQIYTTPNVSNYYSTITYAYQVAIPSPVNTLNKILIIPYLVGITQNGLNFGAAIRTNLINSSYFSVYYTFADTTNGYVLTSYFLIVDVTVLQSQRTIYIDHYALPIGVTLSTLWSTTSNSFQSPTYLDTNCSNKMMGYSGWSAYYGTNPYFSYACASLSISYTVDVYSVGFTVTNFRYRICDFGTPYYDQQTNLCYETCPTRFYGVSRFLYCLPCPYHCLTCNQDGITCLTCSSADFRTLIDITTVNVSMAGVCECNVGYYDDGLNHSLCVACHYSCQSCANASTKCTKCNGYRQLKPDNSCPCVLGFQDIASTPDCTEVCGDGVKMILDCDDGNVTPGDGCSASCSIQTDYSCIQFNKTSPSTCSYNQPLSFTVTSVVVDNTTFSILVGVSVTPNLPWMSTYDFSQLVSNDSDVNITSSTFSSGTVTFTLEYSDLSDGNTVLLTYFSPNTSTTFAIPNSTFSFAIPPLLPPIPQPTTPAYLQTVTKLLYAMTGINIIVYIIGGLKLAYVETMWVLQISYFCLIGPIPIQPLQSVFQVINVAANGYNRVVWPEINVNTFSSNLTAFGYNDQFLANMNIMLLIQMAVLVLSLVFYGLAKITKFKNGKPELMYIHTFLLYDVTFSLVLFNILNSSFAMGLQIIILIEQALRPFYYLNIIGMVLSFGITIISFCLFVFRTNQFTNNVGMLNHDKQSRFHPLVMLCVRFSMGFIMGILYRHWYSGLIVLGIQIAYGIYISIKNPYTYVFLLRAILNEGTILQNLLIGFLYQVARINQNYKGGLVPFWIETFLLGVTCLSSLFYMIYTIYTKIKNARVKKVQIQDEVREDVPIKRKRPRRTLKVFDTKATLENMAESKMDNSEVEFYEGRTLRSNMKGGEY